MGHQLKQLLGNDHPLFTANLAALERAVGGAGVDVRLLADIITRGHRVLRSLGLDPANTTSLEAYRALNNLAGSDAARSQLRDSDFVLLILEGDLVSFNVQDVEENARRRLAFPDRVVDGAQRHLRAEIIRRYADHDRSDNEIVHKLAEEINLKPITSEEHHDTTHETAEHKSHSVLAIGDIFTDAFIKLNEDEARVTTDENGKEWLSVEFGAKMPYDYVDLVRSVGPSPNAAVSFSRLGLSSSLMAFLGDDEVGKESLQYLKEQGVDTAPMVTEHGAKSSYWYVLRYGADRTMLVKNEDYAYEWREPAKTPDWIYLSQISPNAWDLHEKLLAYLEKHPDIKLAFQPGTSHFRWGTEKLKDVYARSRIVIMNREEAMDVTGRPYDSIRDLANGLHDLGPQIVVITDGSKGSYASYDWKLVTIPNYPDPAPPYDRTGAGDAFASTIVAALAQGESMDTALTWAPINSMNVVQHIGAQKGLLTHDEIQEFLSKAPEDYKLTKVEE